MAFTSKTNSLAFAALLAFALSGCGDGSTSVAQAPEKSPDTPAPAPSSTPTPTPSSTPTPTPSTAATTDIVLSGIVSTGAPCANAPVAILASATQPTTAVTAADGSFRASVTVATADLAKPLVITADCPVASGATATLVSVAPARRSGTFHVNPLTNLASALLSKAGDPKKLWIELENGTTTLNAAAIPDEVDFLHEILLPLLIPLGLASTFDPFEGDATANGSGFDRLLDMLDVEITPEANNTSSIAITLKIRNTNETDSQPVIRFTNVTPLDVVKFENQITGVSVQQVTFLAGLIIPSATSPLIADLVGRMSACYALSPQARTTGTLVLAPTCASIFVDGDISNFQENGLRGFDALLEPFLNLASSGSSVTTLLTDAAGTKFSLGTYQYLRPNGVMGLTARKTSPDNSIQTISLEAQVGVDGKLGLSGNQYKYKAKIVPLAERRTFLNQQNSNYLSTGVSISVPLQAPDAGMIPLAKVVVTPPANRIAGNRASFTLLPGAAGMALPSQDPLLNDTAYPSAGGFLRLRTEYTDAISGAGRRHPSRRDLGQYFANDISESALKQFGAGDVWTLDFYLAGATTPDSSQYYRLPARPHTITELRALAMPDLTAQAKTFLRSLLVSDGCGTIGVTPLATVPALDLPSTGDLESIERRVSGYTAPAGAAAPIFFTDSNALFFGGMGTPTAPCSNGANGDMHCARDGSYATGAYLMGVELLSRLSDRRELVHHFSVLQLLP